jgi:hypothetical protein
MGKAVAARKAFFRVPEKRDALRISPEPSRSILEAPGREIPAIGENLKRHDRQNQVK